jgi:hypothetical protein
MLSIWHLAPDARVIASDPVVVIDNNQATILQGIEFINIHLMKTPLFIFKLLDPHKLNIVAITTVISEQTIKSLLLSRQRTAVAIEKESNHIRIKLEKKRKLLSNNHRI